MYLFGRGNRHGIRIVYRTCVEQSRKGIYKINLKVKHEQIDYLSEY